VSGFAKAKVVAPPRAGVDVLDVIWLAVPLIPIVELASAAFATWPHVGSALLWPNKTWFALPTIKLKALAPSATIMAWIVGLARPVPPLLTPSVPVTSALAKFTAELVTVCVDPAKCAMPTPGDDATTHVGQDNVPEPVIVPPLKGELVAIDVTVPLPASMRTSQFALSGEVNVAYCPVVKATDPPALVVVHAPPLQYVIVDVVVVKVTVPAPETIAPNTKLLAQPEDPACGSVAATADAEV
jgi:hypothetical protein